MPVRWCEHFLQGRKPAFFGGVTGTAEAVPSPESMHAFHKKHYEIHKNIYGTRLQITKY
jgi:hypothetical protein